MDLLVLLTAPLITGVLCRLSPRTSWGVMLNILGSTATLLSGMAVAVRVFTTGPILALDDVLHLDALGALLIVLIVVVGFLGALYSIDYLQREVAHQKVPADQVGWYYLGFHSFIWTMILTSVVNDLGLLWVAIEATTVVSALLVGFHRSKAALEAAWKYLILCTVGITFALFGVLLTYYAAVQALGDEAGLNWTTLIAHAGELDPALMKLAFVFVLVGFGTKAGFVPLHTWLPDAHSQAPSPVSAVLSAVLLKCGLYGILRFHLITVGAVSPEFSTKLLLGFGLLSVFVAVPFILVQRDLKRLLAYSSVEHVGLITTAIALGGPLGLYAGLLHLVNHALTKALLFFVAGNLAHVYGTTRMARIRSAAQVAPITASLLMIGTFAISGAPPFGIFVSEFGIIGAGFAQGQVVASIVLIVAISLVFIGFAYHVLNMTFGHSRPLIEPVMVGRSGRLALAIPVFGVVLFGLYVPPPVSQVIQQVAQILGGGIP